MLRVRPVHVLPAPVRAACLARSGQRHESNHGRSVASMDMRDFQRSRARRNRSRLKLPEIPARISTEQMLDFVGTSGAGLGFLAFSAFTIRAIATALAARFSFGIEDEHQQLDAPRHAFFTRARSYWHQRPPPQSDHLIVNARASLSYCGVHQQTKVRDWRRTS
jgi:hypothetical protein